MLAHSAAAGNISGLGDNSMAKAAGRTMMSYVNSLTATENSPLFFGKAALSP